MPSPDLTPYRDLRVYDRDTQEIVEVAIQDLRAKMPGWVPREDNTEVLLIEAMALEVAESIFAINRLPGAIMSVLLQLLGVSRDEGAPPYASIKVFPTDSFTYVVPKGTRFMLTLPGGLDPVIFTNEATVNIPGGTGSATFIGVGSRFTDQANGMPVGTTLEVLDAVSFIDRVELATTVADGRAAETDQAWATRGVARLKRLTDTLVVPGHFTQAALEYTNVLRATTIDLFNSEAGSGTPGSHPGHISVAVYGPGRVLTTTEKAAIDTDFENRALASLSIHVMDPTITSVAVTVSVQRFNQYTDAQTTESITAALSQYLDPSTWPWKGIVRRNELIALISNLPEVDYVTNLSVPASDFALPGVAPLARVGTLNVVVTS